jgi:hypothetical protein
MFVVRSKSPVGFEVLIPFWFWYSLPYPIQVSYLGQAETE